MTGARETITEVWMLRVIPHDDDGPVAKQAVGNFVRSIESTADPILAYASREAAEAGARAHYEQWGIACRAERVLP